MDIMGHCRPEDFAALQQVSHRWRRLAADPITQGHVFAAPLLAALAMLHHYGNNTAHRRDDDARRVTQLARALCQDELTPAGAATSWMHLMQQAQAVASLARTHAHLEQARQTMAPSIWGTLFALCLGGLVVSGVLCDQGTELRRAELLAVGICLSLLTVLLGLSSPLIWLVYNIVGMGVEEAAQYYKLRLDTALKYSCKDIDLLLHEALRDA